MIRLFVLDLDGCTTEPFKSPDWEAFTAIRTLNRNSVTDPFIPQLSLCTGRPQPYAEAIAQMLDIQRPILFESGAGAYDPVNVRFSWHPAVNESGLSQIRTIMAWMENTLTVKHPGAYIEFTKRTDAGIVHSDPALIPVLKHEIESFIAQNGLFLEVHHTPVSVDVLMSGINKGSGITWLSNMLNIPLHQIAYIGDSSGDIPALKKVGRPFAPLNADDSVKNVATALSKPATAGVLQAYILLIENNRTLAAQLN